MAGSTTVPGETHSPEHGGEHEHEVLYGPIALFCIMIAILFGALFDKMRSWGLPVPASIGMMVFGAILGIIAITNENWRETIVLTDIGADMILHVFLPVLIFDGSAGLKLKVLTRVSTNAIFLAGPGVLAGAFSVAGLGVALYSEWTFLQSLLLGAVVAATDPVAVIAVLHDLEADPFVSVLVDSEALLNDGSAIVLYSIVTKAIETGAEALTAGGVIGSVFRFTLLPIPLGIGFGAVINYISIASLTQPLIAGSVQLAGAYVLFYVSDHLAKTSGVLTLLVAGIFIARQKGRHPRSDAENDVRAVWAQLVWIANTLLFGLVGFLIIVHTADDVDFNIDPAWSIGRVFILYIFLNVFRFIMMAVATPLINYTAELPEDRMTWERYVMLSFSGLRGGIGAALGLAVVGNEAVFEKKFAAEFFLNVAGVVILSSFINGWLAGPVVSKLRLNTKEIFSFYALRLALQELKHNMSTTIEHMKLENISQPHLAINWVFVRFMSVNKIENLSLHVEHEARTHGTLSDRYTHIDAAADAAMKGKAKLDDGGVAGRNDASLGAPAVVAISPKGDTEKIKKDDMQRSTPRANDMALQNTVSFDHAAESIGRRKGSAAAADGEGSAEEKNTAAAHDSTQQIENEASCSVFMFCKSCCKENRKKRRKDGEDEDDIDESSSDDDDNNTKKMRDAADYRKQKAQGIALDDRDLGFQANQNEMVFLDESGDDEPNIDEIAAAVEQAVEEVAEQDSAEHNNKGHNDRKKSSNEPIDDNEEDDNNDEDPNKSKKKRGGLPTSISASRALRQQKNDDDNSKKGPTHATKSHPHRVLRSQVNIIKDAELKALKIVSLLNESKERHLMIPIVLRMIKRDLWRQYNEGRLTGDTVTIFSAFIDNRTRTGELFTTEDVFNFIKRDTNLSFLDKIERYILPGYFEEQRINFMVEAAVAFRTMMEHVRKTLPLLQTKQSNVLYWMAWAKLTYSCAVEHERATFDAYPEIAVYMNSRRSAQAVLSQARAMVPETSAMYGLTTHQKKELHDKLFDFAYDALVIKESDSIIHRIRDDAFLAGEASMKEEIASDNGQDDEEMKKKKEADNNNNNNNNNNNQVVPAHMHQHRRKIDADAKHGQQLIELLKNTAIFYSATDELLNRLVTASHSQLYSEHEPVEVFEEIGFIIYGNLSRLSAYTGITTVNNKKSKRFNSGEFIGINVLVFNLQQQSVPFVANEETYIMWTPFEVFRSVMNCDPRVRHHMIIKSALDVLSPMLKRAYPFSALTAAQRRSIICQGKVVRISDSKKFTEFGRRDAIFILSGKEVLPPTRSEATTSSSPKTAKADAENFYQFKANNPHLHAKQQESLAVAPFITLLPEGYNGYFEEGTILIQLHDARLTSQRTPLTGMTFLDVANLSLDMAWTSFTETAKQRDTFLATDVLLEELHKYMHICAGLKSIINKMIDFGVTCGSFRRDRKATAGVFYDGNAANSGDVVVASPSMALKTSVKNESNTSDLFEEDAEKASGVFDHNATDESGNFFDRSDYKKEQDLDESCVNTPVEGHATMLARLRALETIDDGDGLLVVRDCIDELAQHVRIFSLQKHQGNLNRLYVSHVLSAFFSLVIRRSTQWAPTIKHFIENNTACNASASHHNNSTNLNNNNTAVAAAETKKPSVNWTDLDAFCSTNDVAKFMKENGWYTDHCLATLNGWSRLNVETNISAHAEVDQVHPAIISPTLNEAETRTAIFHAKSRARLVASALRGLPPDVETALNKQRLFGRARFQVSKGRSLPGGTSGMDIFAAGSEKGSDGTPGMDSSFSNSQVATERSASGFYNRGDMNH